VLVFRNLLRLLSFAMLSLALAACGDGRQLSGGEPPADSEPSSRAFTGGASKGLILNGIVQAFEYHGGGWTLLSTGTTDDAGQFDLDLTGVTGPVKVVITADASTTMLCDNPIACDGQFGDALSVSALEMASGTPFTMMAIIPSGKSGGTMAVTPVTHLAASLIDSLPDGTPITDVLIELALLRAADIFGLAPDFAWHLPIDITATDSLGNTSSVMHALLSAAFLQASSELGLVVALDSYARQFIEMAGQLAVASDDESGTALATLVSLAVIMAEDFLDGDELAGIIAALNGLVTRWGGNALTAAIGSATLDPDGFQSGMVLLDHLDDYLSLAGIGSDGTFFSAQIGQVNWLYSTEVARLNTQNMALVFYEAAVNTVIASVYLSMSAEGECEAFSGIALAEQPEGYAQLCPSLQQLKLNAGMSEPYLNQLVSLNIDLTAVNMLLAGEQASFAVSGTVMNQTAAAELTGELKITLGEDFAALIKSMLIDGETVSSQDLVNAAEIHLVVTGEGSLSSTADPDWGFVGMIDAQGSLSVPRLNDGGALVIGQVNDGLFRSPEGDHIAAITDGAFCGVSDPLLPLYVAIGDEAEMEACFEFEAFGMPAMQMKMEGGLLGIGDFITQLAVFIPSILSGESLDVTSILNQLDPSVLQLFGSAALEVAGYEAADGWVEARRYIFSVDNNRLDVQHGDHALSVYVTGLQGGYLFAADVFLGTFTVDLVNAGFHVYLVNGEKRSYLLGPLSNVFEPELIELLYGIFGGISGGDGGGDGSGDDGGGLGELGGLM
jgi:hypothetical protein